MKTKQSKSTVNVCTIKGNSVYLYGKFAGNTPEKAKEDLEPEQFIEWILQEGGTVSTFYEACDDCGKTLSMDEYSDSNNNDISIGDYGYLPLCNECRQN